MRANHENLAKARHLPPKRKYEYARKVKEDIQIVADIFRDKFGRTWEELLRHEDGDEDYVFVCLKDGLV